MESTTNRLRAILVGDEFGQLKYVNLSHTDIAEASNEDLSNSNLKTRQTKHQIIQLYDDCLHKGPAASRAIISIKPIQGIYESHLDTTIKPNNLFLIANKVGQLFICNTDNLSNHYHQLSSVNQNSNDALLEDSVQSSSRQNSILTPIYYNLDSKVPICGALPINQTNILIIYSNGDLQHVAISQDVLQSSLNIKRKAIKLLGLGYNNDSKQIHWKIDGRTGEVLYESYASHLNDYDPIVDNLMSDKKSRNKAKHTSTIDSKECYQLSPSIRSRKGNERNRMISAEVINMLTSRSTTTPRLKICKWTSATSLNLLYKKLALFDLIGTGDQFGKINSPSYQSNCFKLNADRLAVAGTNYCLRVYDITTQTSIFNSKSGHKKNPLVCPLKGESDSIVDIDWIGGNRTTKNIPSLLATCTGIDSTVKVYDIRTVKPVFNINLTHATETKWEPYENCARGCQFNRICSSAAPFSTAVPSQQLALGATNGQMHILDLRFVARSHRLLGKLSGLAGGETRDLQFVSESYDLSKVVSCSSDRFVRVHKMHTSFTSVVSHKMANKIFIRTKPTCLQSICTEVINYKYSSSTDDIVEESSEFDPF